MIFLLPIRKYLNLLLHALPIETLHRLYHPFPKATLHRDWVLGYGFQI